MLRKFTDRLVERLADLTFDADQVADDAHACLLGGDPEGAWMAVEQALEKAPDHGRLLATRALVLVERGEVPEAHRTLRRALDGDPNSYHAHYAMALLHQRRKDPKEALQSVRRAVESAQRVEALILKGTLELELGQMGPAVHSLEQALLQDQGNLQTRLTLAKALIGMGNYPRAAAQISHVKDAAPHWSEGYLAHAALFQAMGRLPEAIQQLIHAVEIDPSQAETHARLSSLFEQVGDEAQAIQALSTASDLDPRREWLNRLGEKLLGAGERLLALEAFQTAVEKDPSDVESRWQLALLHTMVGDRAEAQQHLEALIGHPVYSASAADVLSSLETAA